MRNAWIRRLRLSCLFLLALSGSALAQTSVIISPATLPDGAVGLAYSETLTASGAIAPYTFSITGTGALPPGLVLASDGTLSGTPTTVGVYNFMVMAEDDGATSNGFQSYTVEIFPEATIEPGTLAEPQVGVAYEQALTVVNGGAPGYIFGLSSGELPPGLTLASSGVISGTPTSSGAATFIVTAVPNVVVDGAFAAMSFGGGFAPAAAPVVTLSRSYTLSVSPAALVLSPANPADAEVGLPYSHQFQASGGTTPYFFYSEASMPPGLVLEDDGLLHGTPTTAGTYTVEIEVSDIADATAFGSYTLVINATPPGPVPVGVPQAVTTLAGVPVTIFAETGASHGPITAVTIISAPATGSIVQSGNNIEYTPPAAAAAGTVFTIVYTLSNTDGASAPVASTVTIEADTLPPPVAVALEADTDAGTPVSVVLTTGASGAPFTGVALGSLSPQEAGTASVDESDAGYVLTFVPAVGFTGVVVASYTLSNGGGTSAPATVTITVAGRPDPTSDPEVGGLVSSQSQIVRTFSDAQILNAINRLELLHEPGKPLSFWIGGSIRKGDSPGREFETSGVTGGMDYRFSDKFAFGGGLGYGRDRSTIGDNGSRADARAKTGMGYASYRPSLPWFIDMVSGYQRITFQLRRFVTDTGELIEAPRDGDQAFSSWSSGYEHKGENWLVSAYGRMDLAQAKLDAYSEEGDPLHALAFDEQSIQTRTRILGMRGKYKRETQWGTFEPRFRVELQRDFHDESGAAITYSDLQSGPVYVLPGDELDRSRYIIELGTIFKSKWGFVMRLDYRGVRGGMYDDDNAIMFSFQDDH